MLNASEINNWICVDTTVKLQNFLKYWTASTENVPMSPNLLFIISNKSYISKCTGCHHFF